MLVNNKKPGDKTPGFSFINITSTFARDFIDNVFIFYLYISVNCSTPSGLESSCSFPRLRRGLFILNPFGVLREEYCCQHQPEFGSNYSFPMRLNGLFILKSFGVLGEESSIKYVSIFLSNDLWHYITDFTNLAFLF